ncbi:hypothetical protein MY04_4449 [Flammeovirga sp. MY04]|uniref:hypothetical protein n=1 Tax=Flammeovirga sp. MY04 TaxID=1191459 RepID=UPI0008063DFD|nr:hypothetical protein [Flammeovirga sp. MY04]ANQ51785.1 hypothetical protein MY04_4449 [Flammeovirga sp. MY04]
MKELILAYYIKKYLLFVVLFQTLSFSIIAQSLENQTKPSPLTEVTSDVVFSSERFTITFQPDGKITSLKLKDGNEVLLSTNRSSMYIILMSGERVELNKIFRSGDQLIFSTADEKLMASFNINVTPTYISFDMVDFYGNFPVGAKLEFELSARASMKLMAFDYISTLRKSGNSSTLTFEHVWDRYKRDNLLGGFVMYAYANEAEEDESILQAWGNEAIPHPKVSGVWNYDRAKQWVEEWEEMFSDQSVMYIRPQSVEELPLFEPYIKQSDVTTINFFTDVWQGGFWPDNTLNWEVSGVFQNQAELKSFALQQRENGRSINLHYVSGGIGKRDPLYAQENLSDELATWVEGTLDQSISENDIILTFKPKEAWYKPPSTLSQETEIFGQRTESLPTFFRYEYLQIGSELMRISDIQKDNTTGLWQITLSNRSINGTLRSAHEEGEIVKGILSPYNTVFVPDNYSDLFDTVAKNYASLVNDCQVSNTLFDGAEIHVYNGRWGFEKFAQTVYENVEHPVLVRTSNGIPPNAGYMEYKINRTKKFLQSPVGDHNIGRASLRLERLSTTDKGIIKPSSNMLAAQFMLSSQAAYNGSNFSILRPDPMFGITLEEFQQYGKTSEILSLLPKWKTVNRNLTEEQRQSMLETHTTYKNRIASNTAFELRDFDSEDDFLIYPIKMMVEHPSDVAEDLSYALFHMLQEDGMYVPKVEMSFDESKRLINPYKDQVPQFQIRFMFGEGVVVDPTIQMGNQILRVNTSVELSTSSTSYIEYRGGDKAGVFDKNWNLIEEVEVTISGDFVAINGENEITLLSNNSSTAEIELLLFTEGEPFAVAKGSKDTTLKELKFDGVIFEELDNNLDQFTHHLPWGTTQTPTITAVANDANAIVEILSEEDVIYPTVIKVTAEDRRFSKEYVIHYDVEGGYANANILEISIDNQKVEEFQKDKLTYELYGRWREQPTFKVTLEEENASYNVNHPQSGGDLHVIVVTAQNGSTKSYYLYLKEGDAPTSSHHQKENIKVYKSNENTLEIKSNSDLKGNTLLIYHLSGQKLLQKELDGTRIQLPFSSKGIFIIKIIDQHSSDVRKVVF